MHTQAWALITGASSGLGVEFAHQLAAQGYNLLLVARREAVMQQLARQLERRHGIRCHTFAQDLSQPGADIRLVGELDLLALVPDLLINNAGVGCFGPFIAQDHERIQAMLQLNMHTLTGLTQLVAQRMQARGSGSILLISSIAAFLPLPGYAAYGASKAFVLQWGVALREELKDCGIHVSVLAPGMTRTAFFDIARQPITPFWNHFMLPAANVVAAGLHGLRQSRAIIVPGWYNRILTSCSQLLPRGVLAWVAKRLLQVNTDSGVS